MPNRLILGFPSCLHKILLTKFSSAKIVRYSVASPLGEAPRKAAVERSIISALYQAFPLGGKCRRTATNEGRNLFSVICLYLVCIKSSALFSRLPLGGSCPQSGLKRSIVPYSRLPLGGKLSTKLTDEGAATLTLLKNFKQTDSRPPWLPLWGSCPQSGLKRTPPIFSDFSRKK